MARMNRIERRRLNETAVLGISLTLLVLAIDHYGLLHSIDEWAYDRRVRFCQRSFPPSKQIVHLDVDDRALEVIGLWPWPRARLAALLAEVQRAGPKVVGMDVLLADPEKPTDDPDAVDKSRLSAGDAQLAAILTHSGNIVLPAIFVPFDPNEAEPLPRAIHAELKADPELTESELIQKLAATNFNSTSDRERIAATFIASRREAMFERIQEILASSPSTDIDSLTKQLLKSSTAEIDSVPKRILREQYDRAITEQALSRFGIPVPKTISGTPLSVIEMAGVGGAPLPEFSRGISSLGFVDWKSLDWKVARSIPLFIEYNHRYYPQFALAIACRMLDVNPSDIHIENDSVSIPRPGSEPIKIPVHTFRWEAAGRDVPMLMDIGYFGKPNKWTTSYDWPAHKDSKQHISMNAVWEVLLAQRRIERNNGAADINLKFVLAKMDDKEGIKSFESRTLTPSDTDARELIIRETLARKDVKDQIETTEAFKFEELEKEDRDFLGAVRVLRLISQQNAALKLQLAEKRKELAGYLKDKAVLVGWTAVGVIADFVPTSMHESCPGVVIHGTIVNAILTNRFWYMAPKWVAPLVTLFAGLLTAWAAASLSPRRAAVVAAALAASYIVMNGFVIFRQWSVLLNVAGPVVVIAVVWGACALAHTLLEASERAHVERRFRSYVDPSLVDYVQEHAELAHMEGVIREVTVCFTDLVGFTTISERLGTKTVTLLNEYWEVMIPIVRRHNGYVAKFMGDGLFFFYGAPKESLTHHQDAVQSILEMQVALAAFNERTALRDLPALGMRAGINTGNAVVGDAGTRDAADYTALGDVTNLGSRLEGANKGFGTRNLLTQRTADLCDGKFLLRPVGKLRVVGKTEGIFTYEAICPKETATETDHRLVALTRPIVDTFIAARFTDCLTAIEALMNESGPTKFTKLYKSLCQKYLTEGQPEDFDGSIVLTEK